MSEQGQAHRELFTPGHFGCPGCGATVAMSQTLSALGEDTIIVMTAGCWSSMIGIHPYTSIAVPVVSVAYGAAASVAAGIKAGLTIRGNDHTTVLAFAGDGGTFDIGLQPLSGVAERNDDILFICYDNEAYMNTGIQRSSATPEGAWTTTTPDTARKGQRKKNMVEILAAHRIPYAATASIAAPQDLKEKLEKALRTKGSRFIHLFASCPTGWRHAAELSIEVARQAVVSRVFPLYEVTNGDTWRLSSMPGKEGVDAYLKYQGRFKNMSAGERDRMQIQVDDDWRRLLDRCRSPQGLG